MFTLCLVGKSDIFSSANWNYTPFGNRPDLYGWGRTHFERRAFYGQASRGVTFQEHDNQNETLHVTNILASKIAILENSRRVRKVFPTFSSRATIGFCPPHV